jgi:hypothetical protein
MGDLTDMMNAQMDNDQPAYPRSITYPQSMANQIPQSRLGRYTPTTDEVRAQYADFGNRSRTNESRAAFNRWMAAHDAELTERVRRETLEEAAIVSANAFLLHDLMEPGTGPFTLQQHAADEARQQIATAIRTLSTKPERSNT